MTILYEPEISTAGHYEPDIPTAGHYEITASHNEITTSHYEITTSHYEITASHYEFKNYFKVGFFFICFENLPLGIPRTQTYIPLSLMCVDHE